MASPEYKVLIDWDNDGDFTDDYDDVSSDVRGDITIDRGRSDVHGSLSAGTLELTLSNHHRQYTQLNSSSPIYGLVQPHRKIQVQLAYDGTTYYRFTGYIVSYDYGMEGNSPVCYIYAEDRLAELGRNRITLTFAQDTYFHSMVEQALVAAGLTSSEYDIDSTPNDMLAEDLEYANYEVLTILSDIAEAGHHFFYIDGEGVLQFKNRHWAMGNAAYATFYTNAANDRALGRPTKFSFDDKEVNNDITVYFSETETHSASDSTSQSNFGFKSTTINNQVVLACDDSHAYNLAHYILMLEKDIRWFGSARLENLYPDLAQINPGTVIHIEDNDQYRFDTSFVIMGFSETISAATKNYALDLRLEEHRDFALTGMSAAAYDHSWDEYNGGLSSVVKHVGQTFEQCKGLLGSVKIKAKPITHTAGVRQHFLVIQEQGGSGYPNGIDLFRSEPFELDALDDWVISLARSKQSLDLDPAKKYGVYLGWNVDGEASLAFAGVWNLSLDYATVLTIGKTNGSGGTKAGYIFTATRTGVMYSVHVLINPVSPNSDQWIKCRVRGGASSGGTVIATSDNHLKPSTPGECTFTFTSGDITQGSIYRVEVYLETGSTEAAAHYYELGCFKNYYSDIYDVLGYAIHLDASGVWVEKNWETLGWDEEHGSGTHLDKCGTDTWRKLAQEHDPGGSIPVNSALSSVELYLDKVNSPADAVRGRVYRTNSFSTLLQTSNNSVSGAAGAKTLTFTLPATLPNYSNNPAIVFERTGSPNNNQYWKIKANDLEEGSWRKNGSGVWVKNLYTYYGALWIKTWWTWRYRVYNKTYVSYAATEQTRLYGGASSFALGKRVEQTVGSTWSADADHDLFFELQPW